METAKPNKVTGLVQTYHEATGHAAPMQKIKVEFGQGLTVQLPKPPQRTWPPTSTSSGCSPRRDRATGL